MYTNKSLVVNQKTPLAEEIILIYQTNGFCILEI